jgi:hypothetical protein
VQCSQCYLCCRIESVSCLLSCLLRHVFARGGWVASVDSWFVPLHMNFPLRNSLNCKHWCHPTDCCILLVKVMWV